MKSVLILSIIGIVIMSSTMISMKNNDSSEINKQEQIEELRQC